MVVLGLLLYAVSARDPQASPGVFDALRLLLGLSPNKLAALGENLVLLVNLPWSAWLYTRFLVGRGPFSALERWQTTYLPVYAAWAAFVVVAFPPLFGFK